jgi:hypothetical protein
MILSRIQRGATRTNILVRNKIVVLGRIAAATFIRVRRPVGLTVLAAYTATIPLHALQGGIALADSTEPPSIHGAALTGDALAAVGLLGVTTVELTRMHVGKSKEDLRLEALAAQKAEEERIAADNARIAAEAAEKARQQEAIRLADIQQQQQAISTPTPLSAPVASGGNISQIIAEVAGHYDAPPATVALIQRIANCESHFNPMAYNSSGASGVFQFMPGTWRGTIEGRAGKSPFDAAANIEAGVRKMLVEKDWNAWVCYRLVR